MYLQREDVFFCLTCSSVSTLGRQKGRCWMSHIHEQNSFWTCAELNRLLIGSCAFYLKLDFNAVFDDAVKIHFAGSACLWQSSKWLALRYQKSSQSWVWVIFSLYNCTHACQAGLAVHFYYTWFDFNRICRGLILCMDLCLDFREN